MIKGSIVDLITPKHADGAIDFETVEVLVDWHVEEGSAALLVGSSMGQPPAADVEERMELFRRAIWQAEGRIAVVADISGETTEDALEYARAADESGAAAVLLTAPAAALPSQDDLRNHFQAVADAARRPLIVRGSFDHPDLMSPGFVARLSRIRGVAGFAESSADPNRARALLDLELPKDFALYSGLDLPACRLILAGFAGGISVTANVAPALVQAMVAAAMAGDRITAESLDARLQPLHEALLADASSASVKWALVEMGRVAEGQHPPKLPQSSDYSHLRRALRTAQILQ